MRPIMEERDGHSPLPTKNAKALARKGKSVLSVALP
jgi:hypothetical protein